MAEGAQATAGATITGNLSGLPNVFFNDPFALASTANTLPFAVSNDQNMKDSVELMVEYGVHAWDVAALKPIVEEAGGRFSCWDGSTSIHKPDVLVSNGLLHDEVLHMLHGQTYQPNVIVT